jgi:CheY-like chemotaxis protein
MNHRVLLIEDNEQNRYLTTFLLEKNGYSVISAADGIQGIALAETVDPAIILLDIQLPRMNGYDVVRALRERPALRSVPVIAVTSHAMAGDRDKALASGCDGYIEKPIDPDTFVSEIARHLPRAAG